MSLFFFGARQINSWKLFLLSPVLGADLALFICRCPVTDKIKGITPQGEACQLRRVTTDILPSPKRNMTEIYNDILSVINQLINQSGSDSNIGEVNTKVSIAGKPRSIENHVPLLECSYLYTCSSFLAFPSLNISFAQYFIENVDI